MVYPIGIVEPITSTCNHQHLPLLLWQVLPFHLPTVWMARGVAWRLHKPKKVMFRRMIACKILPIILVS
jgi:hypothetical protein